MSRPTILILGAGQVGLEVAKQCEALHPNRIILHCLTSEEAYRATATCKGEDIHTDIIPSWGNVFVPRAYANDEIKPGTIGEAQLIHYLYAPLTPEMIDESLLHTIVERYRPHFIIDAINTATAIGYYGNVHSLMRDAFSDGDQSRALLTKIARTLPEPQLIRFVHVLKESMESFGVERYVKVSTTGMGGMGFNIRYTHGDLGEPGLSTKLLGKITSAGILHQLLWTLHHTPGFNVNLIIPAALIGWGKVEYREVMLPGSKGKPTAIVDADLIPVSEWSTYTNYNPPLTPLETLQGVVVESGENGDYALNDVMAITAYGQMGCVTKQEVAQAVILTLLGKTHRCMFEAMDKAQLSASTAGGISRGMVIAQMRAFESDWGIPSVSYNNMGPGTAKLLWELHIMGAVTEKLKDIPALSALELATRCRIYVAQNKECRQTILSCGIGIISDEGIYAPPSMDRNKPLDETMLKQCVDLRENSLERKQRLCAKVCEGLKSGQYGTHHSGFSEDSPMLPGEFLAFWYTVLEDAGKKNV